MQPPAPYRGRFAPSPSGPLHDGSLVAAMASYLDARAHHGQWLLRIEDIDAPRVRPGADRHIMQQLQALDMQWDGEPTWQLQNLPRYQQVFERLHAAGLVYGCGCTRQDIALNGRHGVYPGTCRHGLPPGRQARAWRLRVPPGLEQFDDRWMGPQRQDVQQEVGDIILKRADGLWAYQFVVVVDDGDQGITDIVRGADLLDSTARQRMLARMLDLPLPRTLHVPLALAPDGRKLSKQNHAPALDLETPLATLDRAWTFLGFPTLHATSIALFWQAATSAWAQRFLPARR